MAVCVEEAKMRTKLVDVRPLIEGLMGEFNDPGGVDWRKVLEGEEVQLVALVSDVDAKVLHVTFQDGVRQVAPAGPFDAIACARALMQVKDWIGSQGDRR